MLSMLGNFIKMLLFLSSAVVVVFIFFQNLLFPKEILSASSLSKQFARVISRLQKSPVVGKELNNDRCVCIKLYLEDRCTHQC